MTTCLVARVIVSMLLLLAPGSLQAADFVSYFGFVTTVPDGWLILSRAELRANADLFDDLVATPGLEGADTKTLEAVQAQIQSGKMELLFRTQGSSPGFVDNMNVLEQIGRVPNETEIQEFCATSASQLAVAIGHSTTVHRCELAKSVPSPSVYIEYDGIVAGTRSMAYQIRKSENSSLVITATASNATANRVRSDLDSIVRNLKLE